MKEKYCINVDDNKVIRLNEDYFASYVHQKQANQWRAKQQRYYDEYFCRKFLITLIKMRIKSLQESASENISSGYTMDAFNKDKYVLTYILRELYDMKNSDALEKLLDAKFNCANQSDIVNNEITWLIDAFNNNTKPHK